jgi:hypothetical protein
MQALLLLGFLRQRWLLQLNLFVDYLVVAMQHHCEMLLFVACFCQGSWLFHLLPTSCRLNC